MATNYNPRIVTDGLVLCLDAGNKKSYSQNEHPNPLDIYDWYTSIKGNSNGNNCTVSKDNIISPVGNTPLKMTVTGTDSFIQSYSSSVWNIAPAQNGETWIVSVYVKANKPTTAQIFTFGANSSGSAFVNGSWLSISASTHDIGTEWTRIENIHTFNSEDVSYIHTRLDGPQTSSDEIIWWDGLQVERVPTGTTSPTPFNGLYHGGDFFKDLSGNSNSGSLINKPYYINESINFNGSDEYIQTNLTTHYPNITLEAWARRNNTNTYGSLVGKYRGNIVENPSQRESYELLFNNNAGVRFHTSINQINYDNSTVINTWYHVVGTYDGTTAKIYLNGNEVVSAIRTAESNSVRFRIGASARGANYLNGDISGVKIYNKALSSQEIQQNFNATRNRFGI